MGFIFSITAGFGAMLSPEKPKFPQNMMMISTSVMGMINVFLIELITTVFLKQNSKIKLVINLIHIENILINLH